jgi:hypothetical protein
MKKENNKSVYIQHIFACPESTNGKGGKDREVC